MSVFLLENLLALNDVQKFRVGFGWDSDFARLMGVRSFWRIFKCLWSVFFRHFFFVSGEWLARFVQGAKMMAERGANKEHEMNQKDAIYSESAKSLFVMLFLVFYRFCLDFYPNMLYYIYI